MCVKCLKMLSLMLLTLSWISTKCDPQPLQNAALHKPATMNSQYIDTYLHSAGWAVDGNNDPGFNNCSCTEDDTVNWWQVDLGDLFNIAQVKVTNRLTWGHRLHDFDIQVSNTSSLSPSDLCFHYPGAMPDGATESLSCDTVTTGRFLRISKVSDPAIVLGDHLTLCEVQVLVLDRKNRKFYRNSGKKVVSSRPLLLVTHRVLCGQSCLQDSTCVGFNFQEGTNICQHLYSTESPVSDTQWWMYSLNLMQKLTTTVLRLTHSGG